MWITTSIFFLVFLFPYNSFSQDKCEYEEISVTLFVQGIGATEIPALICNREIYLPINNVFDFLKIKNTVSQGLDSVTGFFINPEATFCINRVFKSIHYQDKVIHLKSDDLVRTETNLFLRSEYFGDVFGLMCTFNFRSLSVTLNTKIELPAIREMRLEQMHKNLKRLIGESKADTTIDRDYPFFKFGMADWYINSIQQSNDASSDTRLNLSLGGVLAGGETKTIIDYNIGQPFTEKQLYYFWRFADNDNHLLRQVMAGKINAQASSTIYAPVVGVQFTNTPTSFRRSFGYYTLSDYTQPGWLVELYVNNVLVDYVKADDLGFYTFQIPLIYGNTEIRLRFYGPWGEERTSVQNISIPYNFLPPREFEYTVSSGMVEDLNKSIFSRADLNYGLNRYVTVGGGIEYLSSLSSQRVMPFLKTSLNLTSNFLFSGQYILGVKSSNILSYRTLSDIQVELNYTIYSKGQKAISTANLEERKATISIPLRFGNFTMYSRLNINQTILSDMKYTMTDLMFAGTVFGVGANLTTNAWFIDNNTPYIFSNLAISFRLPERFIIRPQAQYDYTQKKLISIKCELEKQLFGTFSIDAVCEKYFSPDFFNFQLGLRYEFPFTQISSLVSYGNKITTYSHSANGSFMYDNNTNYFAANNRTSVSKCGIVILPYLDINGNGRRDLNEPKISGLDIHIDGGRIESSERDTTIRVYDLEPYTNYFVELGSTRLNNISWQITNPTINVAVNPNQFRLIEVPVAVKGEVSGMVYLNKNGKGKQGQGGIYICFYNSDSILVARVLTEIDGYFDFLGLKPGSYTACIDSNQLKLLHYTAVPNETRFTIQPSVEGDIVDGLEFVLEE